ncbi:hypothetical protein SERLA73DRAFT_174865 [Serpula lacrymans var. lacrymans S7.3]|uniref:DUF7719 domain-containing protein n=2 Tax=Serpula lacrymans var. lacrymans TaxID=341189 RepID=F8PIM8_SERL3|nr:uncharacterized protein SERLADRAFT_456557 [Serpula lacrymans var. lacrymans S7.9]EGO03399.1 hypothetical protein SERLA73DRAFT_174865 [Serpula lacrymans var. lacrymans S7.3]EGO29167.1 hypothetical protein SERLADRAFT_456557 [Serpula lacrymans var. lacrymans S7.9]
MARTRKAKVSSANATSPKVEIPEDEQWRLIDESGILDKIQTPGVTKDIANAEHTTVRAEEEETPLADEIFSAAILIMPFTFFFLLMDILIHQQYARQPGFKELAGRLANNIPILSLFVFYTSRHKADRRTQALLFLISLFVGPRMIWLINRGSWLVNMRQCPPFATVWLYAVVQMNLGLAVASLILIFGWVWWSGMKLLL